MLQAALSLPASAAQGSSQVKTDANSHRFGFQIVNFRQPLPSQEAKTSSKKSPLSLSSKLDAGSIIVNPAKLEKLQKIVNIKDKDTKDETGVRRLLVPAGSGHLAR